MQSFLRPLACAAVLAGTAPATLAAIFLFIPGVPGSSTDEKHPNWVALSSLQLGVANRVCSEFVVTKAIDRSSPVLSTSALLGGVYPTMTLDLTNDGALPRSYLTYVLSNVSVTSVSQSTGGDLISESVSLSVASASITYRPEGAPEVTYTLPCTAKK